MPSPPQYTADQFIGLANRTIEQRLSNIEGVLLYGDTPPDMFPDEEARASKVFAYDEDGVPALLEVAEFVNEAALEGLADKADSDASNVANKAAEWREAIGAAASNGPIVTQTTFIDPTSLQSSDFVRIAKQRPTSPMDETAIYFEEKFEAGNSGKWVGGAEVATGFSFGQYSTAANSKIYQYAEARPVIPFTSASIRIEDMGTTGLTIWAVGFQAGTDPGVGQGRVFATYNRLSGITDILVEEADGTVHPTNNPIVVPWDGPFELCLMVAGEGYSVWTRKTDEAPWRFVTSVDLAVFFDVRELTTLNELRPCFYSNKDSGTEDMTISRFRAGYMMGVGIANPSIVTYEDGQPYIKDDRVYFLANATAPVHTPSFQFQVRGSCACIWSLGLSDMSLRCESRINCLRDGFAYGENSGCVVFDRNTLDFILLIPAWGSVTGSAAEDIFIYRTKSDILKGVHLISGTALNLPGSAPFVWDPALRKAGGVWKLIYNNIDGARRILTATSPDLVTWTAAASLVSDCEGSKWLRFGGTWYIISAIGDSSNYLIFDEDLNLLEEITTPTDALRHSIGCHPQFVHVPHGDKSQLMLITFDTFEFRDRMYSWGNLDIYKVGAETNGWEWNIGPVIQ